MDVWRRMKRRCYPGETYHTNYGVRMDGYAEGNETENDGGAGSGNWGHSGRKGQIGGSKGGTGGKQHRLSTPSGGYTSMSQAYKENEKRSKSNGTAASKQQESNKVIHKPADHYTKGIVYEKDQNLKEWKGTYRDPLTREKKGYTGKTKKEVQDLVKEQEERYNEIYNRNYEEYGKNRVAASQIDMYAESLWIDSNAPKKLDRELTTDEIVSKIGGYDKTEGSCTSLAIAYAANKGGLDAKDYRGGDSRKMVSYGYQTIFKSLGANTSDRTIDGAKKMLSSMQEGKEYIFTTGLHTSVVRKKSGTLQYLELQSTPSGNGWINFTSDITSTLKNRFGSTEGVRNCQNTIVDIDKVINNAGSNQMLNKVICYINTDK